MKDKYLAQVNKIEVDEAWEFYIECHPRCIESNCSNDKVMYSLLCQQHLLKVIKENLIADKVDFIESSGE